MLGRPDELTPELSTALLNALRRTLYVETACALTGIHRNTLRTWQQRARRALLRHERHGEEVPEADRPHVALMEGIARATAEAQDELVVMVVTAGREDWRAAGFVLERRWPDQWGSLKPELRERDKREAALIARVNELEARLAAIPVQVQGQTLDGTLPQLPPPNGASHNGNGSNGNGTNGNGKH